MKTPLSRRLRIARLACNLTQIQLAEKIGVLQGSISRIENGVATTPYLFKLAEALKVSAAWLSGDIGNDEPIIDSDIGLHKDSISSILGCITVRGTVAAGLWSEDSEWPEENQYKVPFDTHIFNEYASDRVFSLKVRGDSMDMEYKEGTYLYCVPMALIKRKLATGDHVIVEREHTGKFEATIKEIEFDQSGKILLWPRSHNPDHQSALVISDPTIANRSDNTIIKITAIVIGHFYKR